MKESTIQGLLATFQAIANMTEDEAVVAVCREALAQAQADAHYTAEIPEPLLLTIHLYMVAAHSLARAASDQPAAIKGLPHKSILVGAIDGAGKAFNELSEERQRETLIISAQKLGELSGALFVEHNEI